MTDRWNFTTQQSRVAKGLLDGKSNAEIGRALEISEKTVKAHVTAIYKILEVDSRTKATLRLSASHLGILGTAPKIAAFQFLRQQVAQLLERGDLSANEHDTISAMLRAIHSLAAAGTPDTHEVAQACLPGTRAA